MKAQACSHCGKNIGRANFCLACGKPTGKVSSANEAQRRATASFKERVRAKAELRRIERELKWGKKGYARRMLFAKIVSAFILLPFGLLVGAFLIYAIVAPAPPSKNGQTQPLTKAKSVQPELGTPIVVGRFEYIVDRVQWKSSIGEGSPFETHADANFLVLSMRIDNNDRKPRMIDHPRLVDPAGRTFASTFILPEPHQQCVLQQLNPGVEAACAFIFDVPYGTYSVRLGSGATSLLHRTRTVPIFVKNAGNPAGSDSQTSHTPSPL